MFSSKKKTIKRMSSSDKFKKVRKAFSKFLFNESIRCSEKSRGIREADDDDGEDVRVLSSSVMVMVKMAMTTTTVISLIAVVLMMTIMKAIIVLMEGLIVLKVIYRG